MGWAQCGITTFIVTFGLLLNTSVLRADFIVGPPPWSNTSIQSTGGITYFSHTATLDVCDRTFTTYQGRSGTNLSMYAAETQGEICPLCFGCTYVENGAAVFGSLAPGDYALYLYTPDDFGGPGPVLRSISHFQIPPDLVPTLKISNGPNANQVLIEVTGHRWAN